MNLRDELVKTRNNKTTTNFFSGNDVYVASFENNGTVNVAKYWKNGSPVILGDASKYSEAYCIFLAIK